MNVCFDLRSANRQGLLACMSLLLWGCTGNEVGGSANPAQQSASQQSATQDAPITGASTLDLTVVDPEGRPLTGASVTLTNVVHQHIDSETTNTSGMATFVAIPHIVHISVRHVFGDLSRLQTAISREGRTSLSLALQPRRPQPTVAVFPPSIPPDSVSEDRRELTLEFTIVASASAPFVVGNQTAAPTVYLTSSLWTQLPSGQWCDAILRNGEFHCLQSSDDGPFTTLSRQTLYVPSGIVPALSTTGPIGSAMLVLDQSGRVSELDSTVRRSFAARQFIGRLVTQAHPKDLAVGGLSGHGTDPGVVSLLPEQPLWELRGAGTVFTRDRAVLDSAVDILEPLVGGSAPVFEALEEAIELTAAHAAPGTGAVVALLGGGDTLDRSPSEHRTALASLRQLRDAAKIQAIVVAGVLPSDTWTFALAADDLSAHMALAELSTALRAPVISMGRQTWGGGSFGALDIAADLLERRPLPTVSATFRITSGQPDAFASGSTLYGWVALADRDSCGGPSGCERFTVPFAVEVP